MKYAQPFLFFRKLSYLIRRKQLKSSFGDLPLDEINKLIEKYRKED